jgi:carboxypeptidase C (cathepsin A)
VLNTRVNWNGKDHWLDAPRGLWKTDGYPSGWAKEYGNLTFAVVYNSGHMVPYKYVMLTSLRSLYLVCVRWFF